jgi:Mg/Co/Ni transporter MgtE
LARAKSPASSLGDSQTPTKQARRALRCGEVLDAEERAIAFRLLEKDRALAVFEAFDPIHQQQLLDALPTVGRAHSQDRSARRSHCGYR